jgi:hypothetical protein
MRRTNPSLLPAAALGLCLLAKTSALSEEPQILEYTDPAGAYVFSYPDYYKVTHEFADGTGDTIGVRAEMASPDGASTEEANIEIYAMEPRAVKTLTEENFDAYVEQFKKDFEPDHRIKFVSVAKTEILGQLGADIQFDQKGYSSRVYALRIIATIIDGKDYFVRCVHSPGYRDEFSYHCQFAAESLSLTEN